ncbi:MAG: tetratricopeptide repeat protein [Rhodospirillales bacterium]|nr:tetratricopeptide repeat protein [Rhodospirillales bacterium]
MARQALVDGRHGEARRLFERGINLALREKKIDKAADALGDLALVYFRPGRYELAENLLRRSVKLIQEHNLDPTKHGGNFFKLGEVLFRQGKEESGLRLMLRGASLYKESRKIFFLVNHSTKLAKAYSLRGDLNKAEQYLKEADQTAKNDFDRNLILYVRFLFMIENDRTLKAQELLGNYLQMIKYQENKKVSWLYIIKGTLAVYYL